MKLLTLEQALKQIIPKSKLKPRRYRDCGDCFLFSVSPPGVVTYDEPWLRVDKATGEETSMVLPLFSEYTQYEVRPVIYGKNLLARIIDKLFPEKV